MKAKKEKVAMRYGKAIFSLAQDLKKRNEFFTDFRKLKTLFNSKEINQSILNPQTKESIKVRLLEMFLDKLSISDNVRNVIFYLYKKKRLQKILSIISEYEELYYASFNVVFGECRLAVKPEKTEQDAILQKLEKIVDAQVKLKYIVDESLIGGFVADLKSIEVDASIKGYLERFNRRIDEM